MGPTLADPRTDELYARELLSAINRTQGFFAENQHSDGYWVAELEGDALLQSETILLLAFLGEENCKLAKYCANDLIATQLPGGGWGMYPDAEADIHNTVKGYFALKLTGHDPSAEYMQRARRKVMELGGAEKINSFTRFYLAILGQIPHDQCPAVPPQMMYLPKWFPINISEMSAWSRTIFVPLSIVSALQPVKKIPAERGIRELFTHDSEHWPPIIAPGRAAAKTVFSWDKFFRSVDKMIWFCRKIGFKPLHKAAIEKAKTWMLDHFDGSDGPGAIYPPIIWSWVALKALGYSDDSKEVQYCRKQLDDLVIWEEESQRAHVQPCKSPVWDTSLTLKALRLSGLDDGTPMVKKGVDWIKSQQLSRQGDWAEKINAEPGGWCFEFHNEFYPDNDDTAMALMVLGGCLREPVTVSPEKTAETVSPEKTAEIEKGLRWLFAMQNDDGGWGAFDKNNHRELLCRVPFADHNAMIDPSTPDLTGRVLESLGRLGYKIQADAAIDRCVAYMKKVQQPDGSWFGRWGVNYIYGTWQALTGLTAVGVLTDDPAIAAGKNWLLAHQQPSGGWGESPNSYIDPKLRGQGKETASQTAWAVMGLLAAGLHDHPATQRGIRFLLDRQQADGTWLEPEFTGTGFPLVFYLRYHYYRIYFPLMALSLYAQKANVANIGVLEAEPPVRNIISIREKIDMPTEMARKIGVPYMRSTAESTECILRFDTAYEQRNRNQTGKPHITVQNDSLETDRVPYLRLYSG